MFHNLRVEMYFKFLVGMRHLFLIIMGILLIYIQHFQSGVWTDHSS